MNITVIKEQYFSFQGRLNRKRFILRSLVLAAIGIIIAIPIFINVPIRSAEFYQYKFLLRLLFIVPILSLYTRRLHDLNRPTWCAFLYIIPIVNFFIFIYATFFKGTGGENKYGPDPLSEENKVTSM